LILLNDFKGQLTKRSAEIGLFTPVNKFQVKVEAGEEEAGPKVAPYALTATLNEPGLGLLSWWT
jgi:hypothetical protein